MNEDEVLKRFYIIKDNNKIRYRFLEEDSLIQKSEINHIEEKDAITLQNIEYPIPAYYVNLYSLFGDTINCGNVINTFFTLLKSKIDNVVLVIDFIGIKEVSENFCSHYYKYLLITKNKVITINEAINVSNIFAEFVLNNSYDITNEHSLKNISITLEQERVLEQREKELEK